MAIPLRIVDPRPPYDEQEPGMMWAYTDEEGECGWWIILPNDHPDIGTPGHPGVLSWRTTDRASDPPHEKWAVSGEAPNLTVTPSIDVLRYIKQGDEWVRDGSYWHGFITNGELVG